MPPRPRRRRRPPPPAPGTPPAATGRIRGHVEEIAGPPPVMPPTVPAATPAPAPQPQPQPPEPARRVRPDEDAQRPVRLAGVFADASAAAGFLGQLLDQAEARLTVHHGQDRWWVMASIPLNLGRELIELAGGHGYVRHADRLVPDPGWGPAPRPAGPAGIPLDELGERPVLDLIKAAGMYARRATAREQVTALVPTKRAPPLLRRALDLRLNTTFRPVRLRPLFAPETASGGQQPEQAPGTLVEVRRAGTGVGGQRTRYVPETLIDALAGDREVLLCREVSARLLIQYNRHSPLTDRQLDALVTGDAWVLADPPHGCWSLTPLAEFAPAGSLIRLGRSHQLGPGKESWPDHGLTTPFPDPAELKIVPALDHNDPIDALLLDDADLASLPLLLQGHPLAEFASVVRGRNRHLLVAPGGILERMPLGEYLACVGPGPIYLAHGWRTEPRLPAVVWRQLISVVPGWALVLEPARTMVFDLSLRRPVWELWAGELPPFDPQLPDDATELLARMEEQLRAAARRGPGQPGDGGTGKRPAGMRGVLDRLTGGRARSPRQPDWRERADQAELAGELLLAARLHEQNGEPERAGRLYERAAYEGPGGSGRRP